MKCVNLNVFFANKQMKKPFGTNYLKKKSATDLHKAKPVSPTILKLFVFFASRGRPNNIFLQVMEWEEKLILLVVFFEFRILIFEFILTKNSKIRFKKTHSDSSAHFPDAHVPPTNSQNSLCRTSVSARPPRLLHFRCMPTLPCENN